MKNEKHTFFKKGVILFFKLRQKIQSEGVCAYLPLLFEDFYVPKVRFYGKNILFCVLGHFLDVFSFIFTVLKCICTVVLLKRISFKKNRREKKNYFRFIYLVLELNQTLFSSLKKYFTPETFNKDLL